MDRQKETAFPFGAKEDSCFELLNPSYGEYVEKETPFVIQEKTDSGKAEIRICSAFPCFVIRDLDGDGKMKTPNFLKNEKNKPVSSCADHAIFLFDREREIWTLHIFELKRSPDNDKWSKILCQFNGAVIRAYALAGVVRIPEFAEVCLYCGYRNDKSLYMEDKSSPNKLKSLWGPVSVTQRVLNGKAFEDDTFSLISYPKRRTKNHLIKLDSNGYAEIQLSCAMKTGRLNV